MPRVFVYGSLRRGQTHHALLAGAAYVGTARTPPRYRLVNLGDYPALLDGGTTAVEGELYDVTDATLALLDEFEEHPRVYRRGAIVLADGESAQAYLLPPSQGRDAPELPRGRRPPRPLKKGRP